MMLIIMENNIRNKKRIVFFLIFDIIKIINISKMMGDSMKYWWLEKYSNFKFIQITDLIDDVNYFLIMPKDYEKRYFLLEKVPIDDLPEEDLLILLKGIIEKKKIKDNKLNLIINRLLTIPDNSFPESDYSLKEMLEEIKQLKYNLPNQEKIETNNIAVCYHCLNVFYVDQIKSVNQKGICLCPFCHSHKLYFDNDYIPMNTIFIKLAHLYYHTSNLGCTFRDIQKIIKKSIITECGKKEKNSIDFSSLFSIQKINPIDEKIIIRKIYQELMNKNKDLIDEVSIYLMDLNEKIENQTLLLLFIAIIEVLSTGIYLKKITVRFKKENQQQHFLELLKTVQKFH